MSMGWAWVTMTRDTVTNYDEKHGYKEWNQHHLGGENLLKLLGRDTGQLHTQVAKETLHTWNWGPPLARAPSEPGSGPSSDRQAPLFPSSQAQVWPPTWALRQSQAHPSPSRRPIRHQPFGAWGEALPRMDSRPKAMPTRAERRL